MKPLGSRLNPALVLRAILLTAGSTGLVRAEALGQFEDHIDIGSPSRAGAATFEKDAGRYTITGGGENMWRDKDALHFVWKKISGDVTLAADILFQGQGGDPHRKACLIIRQDLEPGSAYADAAFHGDGLTSLQYREAGGALTHEIQSNVSGPRRLRLEKRGDSVSMSLAGEGGRLQPAGGSFRLELKEPFYIGLGVCAHDDKALETAVFSNVDLFTGPPKAETPKRPAVRFSTLETITVASTDRRVVLHTEGLIEAPNWSRTGDLLYFNAKGRIHRVPAAGGADAVIDTGSATRCNNDHGLSPDGTQLVISDQSQDDHRSRISLLPVGGGAPRLITPDGPSYWHGWSPDGLTLAYCAERNGEFDIYTIPTSGGSETRLTTAKGLDDGPDYSPDGKFIYFNSDRTGTMHVWRMKPDGSEQEQVTKGDDNNWFPHPSPDGKLLVFLTYDRDVKGHPEDKDVRLRLLTLATGQITTLAKLFGGQGTINVPSWSPDSKRLAFVSYQLVDPQQARNQSPAGRPLKEAFIAKELLPTTLLAKADLTFSDPKYHDWAAYDGYPSRAQGNYSQGIFTLEGLAFAFREICGVLLPAYVQPIIGELNATHYSDALQKMALFASCYYKCPVDQMDELRASVEHAWRSKSGLSEEERKWRLETAPVPERARHDSMEFDWSAKSVAVALDEVFPGGRVGFRHYHFTVDPESGLVRLDHWEGDHDE